MGRRRRWFRAVTIGLAVVTLTAACSGSSRHAAGASATTARDGVHGRVGVNAAGVYADTNAGMFNAVTREARPLIYVPESIADRVDVIDPTTYRVIGSY